MIIYYEQVHEEGYSIDTSFSFAEGDDKFDITSFSGRVDKQGMLMWLLVNLIFIFPAHVTDA